MSTIEGKTASEWFEIGIDYNKKGKYNSAIDAYTNAIQLQPDDAAAYNNRGVIYGYMNNWNKLISDYEKVLSFGVDKNGITRTGEHKAYYEKWIREAKVKDEADSKPKDTQPSMVTTPLRDTAIKDGYGGSIL